MRTEELKLTIHLGRGYGQAFHNVQNKPVTAALEEILSILQTKYGFDINRVRVHPSSTLVRRRRS